MLNQSMHEQEQRQGALEAFIRDFNAFEVQQNLFEFCRDAEGFAWWDCARYSVQAALGLEKNLCGTRAEKTPPMRARLLNQVRRASESSADLLRFMLLPKRRIRALCISMRPLDSYEEAIAEEGFDVRLYLNATGYCPKPHLALRKYAFDLLQRYRIRGLSAPLEVQKQAQEIALLIRQHFGTSGNLVPVMLARYVQAQAGLWLWRRVLAFLPSLERIYYVNDDGLKPLVMLARARGISCIELQHGYMGISHFAFSYPPLSSPLETIPDVVWISRDTGDIIYPAAMRILPKPQHSLPQAQRDIDVLVGGSPARSEEMRQIVSALVGQRFRVALKLHPTQTVESSGLSALIESQQVVLYDRSENFAELAVRTKIFVPANPNSTTSFEAYEAGAKLIIVDYNGEKITSMCDNIVAARVSSIDALCPVIESHLNGL